MSAHTQLTLNPSSSIFPLIKTRSVKARKKPTVTIHAVRNAPASSWSLSLLISAVTRICDRHGLPPVSDTPQILKESQRRTTMSSPSLRLNRSSLQKVEHFASSTGREASSIANEAIAFWYEFSGSAMLEEIEKKPPQPAGRNTVKRRKA
jgi:hypothetical protein